METTEIGYFSKTHGLKGQIVLRLDDYIDIDTENINSIFINIDGAIVPHFLESIQPNNIGYIIKLEGIDAIEVSKKLIGKKASVLPDFIIEDEDSLQEFVTYQVIDQKHGSIGTIVAVDDKTENVIITVAHPNGKEIILPLNDDFIKEINDDLKQISYNAPDGLIEMYLS
jgi:16S rRNA processing protein RimM